MEERFFTKESYASFLNDRPFVTNHIERKETESFFDIVNKTDLSKDEEGRNVVDFLKSRM